MKIFIICITYRFKKTCNALKFLWFNEIPYHHMLLGEKMFVSI